MESTLIECEPATDANPIAQGDVFEWKTPRFGHSLGIIVTADCDIAWNKFGAFLTYVPILPLHDYLRTDYLSGQCRSAATKLLRQIALQIEEIRERSRPEFSRQIEAGTLERWLLDSATDDIIQALNAPESRAMAKLRDTIENWRELQSAPSKETAFEQQVDLLIRSTSTTESAINKRIHDHVQRLPGDRLYLTAVGGRDEAGFVVMIRNLREIAEDEIAIKATQQARPSKRIARLSSPYRYRLTQQLGDVFAAIGLPEEYERRRDELLLQSYKLKESAK